MELKSERTVEIWGEVAGFVWVEGDDERNVIEPLLCVAEVCSLKKETVDRRGVPELEVDGAPTVEPWLDMLEPVTPIASSNWT